MTTYEAERARRLKELEIKVDSLPDIIGNTSVLLKLAEEYRKLTEKNGELIPMWIDSKAENSLSALQ